MHLKRSKKYRAYIARKEAILSWDKCLAALAAGELMAVCELDKCAEVVGHCDRNFVNLMRTRQ